jgi:hypothetical protein
MICFGCPTLLPSVTLLANETISGWVFAGCMQGHGAHGVRAIHEAENPVDKGRAHGGTHTSSLCPEEERLPPERRNCCDKRECSLSKHTVTCDFRGVEFIWRRTCSGRRTKAGLMDR